MVTTNAAADSTAGEAANSEKERATEVQRRRKGLTAAADNRGRRGESSLSVSSSGSFERIRKQRLDRTG